MAAVFESKFSKMKHSINQSWTHCWGSRLIIITLKQTLHTNYAYLYHSMRARSCPKYLIVLRRINTILAWILTAFHRQPWKKFFWSKFFCNFCCCGWYFDFKAGVCKSYFTLLFCRVGKIDKNSEIQQQMDAKNVDEKYFDCKFYLT